MTAMNKEQFAQELSERHGMTPEKAAQFVDDYHDTLIRVLVTGKADRITFDGVGTFEATEYVEKRAWDLSTNSWRLLPRRRVVRFRPGVAFRKMMRGERELPQGRSAAWRATRTLKSRTDKDLGDA